MKRQFLKTVAAAALATETPLAIEQRLGIRIYTGCKVERIDAQAQRLYTSLGEMDYGQLVLASGASPVRLPIEGRAEALLSVNNLQDYYGFRQRLSGIRRVAILGDGLIGCEFANDLAHNGFEVDVIGLGRWPMGSHHSRNARHPRQGPQRNFCRRLRRTQSARLIRSGRFDHKPNLSALDHQRPHQIARHQRAPVRR